MIYDFADLVRIMNVLRGDGGCPWDKAQTHESMRKYMIEEVYEAAQAIDDKDSSELCEELGDVLFQVLFQAKLAEEEGLFSISDVINGVSTKMIKRHPHIFGGENADDYNKLTANNDRAFLGKWEDNKKKEKGYATQTDVLRAIPAAIPALMRAEKVLFKAENAGLDLTELEGESINADALLYGHDEMNNNKDKPSSEQYGDIMLRMANFSRKNQLNAEFSLTKAIEKFINKFEYIESSAANNGLQLKDITATEKKILWQRADNSAADEK